jgi:HEAT repeat protein
MGIFAPNIKKMEKKRNVEGLFKALQHFDSDVRERAAFALDRLGWKAGDDTEKARYLMAKKEWDDLTELGGPAVEPIVQALKDGHEDVVKHAGIALERIVLTHPAAVVEPLIQALKSKPLETRQERGVRCRVAEILGVIGDARAVEPIVQALNDRHEDVRKHAGIALERLVLTHSVAAVEPLIRVLDEGTNRDVRVRVAETLGKIGDARAIDPLIRVLEDMIEAHRRRISAGRPGPPLGQALREDKDLELVQEALGRIGEPAIEPLIRARKEKGISEGSQFATATADAVRYIGQPAIEPLVRTLKDKDWSVRGWAATRLGDIGDVRAVEPLVRALRDDRDARVRSSAAGALGRIGDVRAMEPLVRALKEDRDLVVRMGAVRALDELSWNPADDTEKAHYLFAMLFMRVGQTYADRHGFIAQTDMDGIVGLGRHAAEPLIQSLDMEERVVLRTRRSLAGRDTIEWSSVQAMALSVLLQIGEPAVEPLIQALKDSNSTIRGKAAYALGEIRDARAAEPLVQALEDEDKKVREAAREALKKIKVRPSTKTVCAKCGSEVKRGNNFCTTCGAKLSR